MEKYTIQSNKNYCQTSERKALITFFGIFVIGLVLTIMIIASKSTSDTSIHPTNQKSESGIPNVQIMKQVEQPVTSGISNFFVTVKNFGDSGIVLVQISGIDGSNSNNFWGSQDIFLTNNQETTVVFSNIDVRGNQKFMVHLQYVK